MMSSIWRAGLVAFSMAMIAACNGATSDGPSSTPSEALGDVILGHAKGDANAPITIIEYASPTCPACKYWHEEVGPTVQEKYVETGKVRFIFREFPLNEIDVAAYAMARCAGEGNYFNVLDDLFANQNGIRDAAAQGVAKVALLGIGSDYGIEDEEAFDACTNNKEIRNALVDTFQTAENYGVSGTPTFVVNNEVIKYENFRTAEEASAYLNDLLGENAPVEAPTEAPSETEDAQ